MKVVLLTTARIQRPATYVTLKEQLGVVPGDDTEVSVITWYPPKRPLPVQTNLLVGPVFTVSRHARALAVADPGATHGHLDDASGADAPWSADRDESVGSSLGSPAPPGSVYDPRRVAKAVHGRVNTVRVAVRAHPTVSRVGNSTKLRKVRKVRHHIASGSLGWQYAVACLTARNVHQEIEGADVVVALDGNTYRTAWLLARQHARPAFVVGAAGGKRVLAERAATTTS